jgi:hypothetical protein
MSNFQVYHELQQIILRCRSELTSDNRSMIAETVQTIENCFRQQILATRLDDDVHHSIHVEINKQLRLLKTDCLFLRSAKQPHIVNQRLQQMADRLVLLERYCEMILAVD